ncbi:MAG: sulfurtransferase, partial [Marivita sp.]
MKFLAPAFVAALGLASAVEANTYGPLVTPAELAASIDDVQPILIDIRNDGYAEAHVDGALWAPYRMFRGPEENPGALVDVTALEGNLE